MAKKKKTSKGKSSPSTASVSESLAVKYRPRTLDDLVGQDAVAIQVSGMVKKGRFPPTMGLFGESGGGKTTTARMIARYINCLSPTENGAPCDACASCMYGDVHPDVHEINMANKRGIDDARSLIDSARSMPTVGNKRVFILDEMHSCFRGDTRVMVEDGTFLTLWQIDDLLETGREVVVISYNTESGVFEPKKVTNFISKTAKREELSRVYVTQLGCQAYIESTRDHKLWNKGKGEWSESSEFKVGEQLLSNIPIETEVTGIELLEGEEKINVYDLTVADNHTYLILPVGGTHPIVVSNCTPQAFQTFLKPLEEPPEHTVWILATTDPQKLPSTIMGRCHKFHIKPIAEEVIVKRLRTIAKREGVDMKELDGGKEILSTIANLSNGRMRDSISALESVLFAIASGRELSAKRLISDFATTAEADLDKAAGTFLAAVFMGKPKIVIQTAIDSKNVRGLIAKTRWLLQGLISQAVERPFFKTYSWKVLTEKMSGSKTPVRLSSMLEVQDLLCNIEIQLNSVSIDETVLFTSRVGSFLSSQKALPAPN